MSEYYNPQTNQKSSYKLSPSDFAYLYEECKRCFYLKVKEEIARPRGIFPAVFTAINNKIQLSLIGKSLQTLSKDLPDIKIINQEGYVKSIPVPNTSLYISGRYDLLAEGPEGKKILIDLKISRPDEEKVGRYKTQLYAYKYALENPKQKQPVKISQMGLLIFYPNTVTYKNNTALLEFPPKWLEIPQDENMFLDFTEEIDKLLSGPVPPENEECGWCKYRNNPNTI